MQNVDLSQWIGRTSEQVGCFDLGIAQKLAATLGTQAGAEGDPISPLAHWCAFTPLAPTQDLGRDGHPVLGGFLPPVPLERRMWAGGTLQFHAPLRIGAPITRRSTITDVVEKSGAAGPMVFVTVAHELHDGETLAVSEIQDIVYLQIPERYAPPKAKPVPEAPQMLQRAPISAALLFRYSAVTFNAHRIHYDLPYAQEVEKYPGLVVHGPLQATLLLNAAMQHTGRTPQKFSFRGIHPMFHDDDLHLFGQATDAGMTLCSGIPGGHQGMQAKMIWED